jgi:hypothetical protein
MMESAAVVRGPSAVSRRGGVGWPTVVGEEVVLERGGGYLRGAKGEAEGAGFGEGDGGEVGLALLVGDLAPVVAGAREAACVVVAWVGVRRRRSRVRPDAWADGRCSGLGRGIGGREVRVAGVEVGVFTVEDLDVPLGGGRSYELDAANGDGGDRAAATEVVRYGGA